MASTSSREIQDSCELLPGIADDLTLSSIVTKLKWSDLPVLSSISPAWRRAIQSRRVYHERLRLHSTETLVAIKHVDKNFPDCPKYTISLYSLRNKTFYQLPSIPHRRGISRYSQLGSMDGKLYVVGADCRCECHICSQNLDDFQLFCTAEMDRGLYVLDLAGQGQWEECPIRLPNLQCQCNCTDGCAFAIEGTDFWWGGCAHRFSSWWLTSDPTQGAMNHQSIVVTPSFAHYLDIIPGKQFIIGGNFYWMGPADVTNETQCRNHIIYFYDVNRRSWVLQHSISSDGVEEIEREIGIQIAVEPPLGPEFHLTIDPLSILCVNNELLALSRWVANGRVGYILLQSIGFGTASTAIVWEKTPNSFWIDFGATSSMCPIQL